MPTRKSAHPVAHAGHASRHAPHARHARHVELDAGDAFVPDFRHGFVSLADGDAEAFGEEFICAVTSAEAVAESARDEIVTDELEGLSLETIEEAGQ